jgi:hypothetical protein
VPVRLSNHLLACKVNFHHKLMFLLMNKREQGLPDLDEEMELIN